MPLSFWTGIAELVPKDGLGWVLARSPGIPYCWKDLLTVQNFVTVEKTFPLFNPTISPFFNPHSPSSINFSSQVIL